MPPDLRKLPGHVLATGHSFGSEPSSGYDRSAGKSRTEPREHFGPPPLMAEADVTHPERHVKERTTS